jgi:hypothetical protein
LIEFTRRRLRLCLELGGALLAVAEPEGVPIHRIDALQVEVLLVFGHEG